MRDREVTKMAKNNKSTSNELDYYSLMNQIADEEYNSFVDLISNALDIENLPEAPIHPQVLPDQPHSTDVSVALPRICIVH